MPDGPGAPAAPAADAPFVQALRGGLHRLPPHLRAHFEQREAELVYDGVMESVWRARGLRGALAWPGLWMAARLQTVFPETGRDVPFTIAHRVNGTSRPVSGNTVC